MAAPFVYRCLAPVEAIQLVHSASSPEGLICFGSPRDFAAAHRDDLPGCWSTICNKIRETFVGFFSINSFRERFGWARFHGLPQAKRCSSKAYGFGLVSLNAFYVDLDHHKRGLPVKEAEAIIAAAVGAGIVPEPSILVRSGEGTWLIWLLHPMRERERLLPEFRLRDVLAYKAANKAIHERLLSHDQRLAPDPGAVDASRVMRIPGTLNKGETVTFFAAEQGGVVPRYGFDEMLEWLCVDLDAVDELHMRTMKPKRAKAPLGRLRSQYVTAKNRRSIICALASMRRPIPEGSRFPFTLLFNSVNRVIFTYEHLDPAKPNLETPEFRGQRRNWILNQLFDFSEMFFCPSYDIGEAQERAGKDLKYFGNEQLSHRLDLKVEEWKALTRYVRELIDEPPDAGPFPGNRVSIPGPAASLRPLDYEPVVVERTNKIPVRRKRPHSPQRERRIQRRIMIKNEIERRGSARGISIREWQQILISKAPELKAAKDTIRSDLKAVLNGWTPDGALTANEPPERGRAGDGGCPSTGHSNS